MLWPSNVDRALRSHLFGALASEEPNFVVNRWHEYKYELEKQYLPEEEIDKIRNAAIEIVDSFETGFPVQGILIQGHADFDLRRHGKAREDFEMNISRSRANEVATRLRSEIGKRLLSPNQVAAATLIVWQEEGLGSHRRVTNFPHSERERSWNRRVEVFYARGSLPFFPVRSLMTCPHAGIVTRGEFAQGYPTVTDPWRVLGCPNVNFGLDRPSPCETVQWLPIEGNIIDFLTPGMCLSGDGLFQGMVMKLA